MSIVCFNIPGGKLSVNDGHVIQMEYSPIIGGYTMVLSSGKALFMVPPTTKTENNVSYKYSPIIGGYTMVLSSGKALFMVPPTTKTENNVSYNTVLSLVDIP